MTAEQKSCYRSLGSRLQYRVFEWMVACRAVPLARVILGFVVLYYTLRPSIRGRCAAYLRHRFGASGPLITFWRAYRLYLQFGQALLDRMIAGALGRFPIRRPDAAARQWLQHETGSKKGDIVLSAHFGAWQLGLAGLEQFDRTVHVLQHPILNDPDKHYFERGNGRPYHIIDATDAVGALVEAAAALRRGDILCLMGDRVSPEGNAGNRVTVPFLGGEIALPTEAYALASITGASITMLFNIREKGVIYPCIAASISVPRDLPRHVPQAFRPFALLFAQALERLVGKYPYQFFNFYDMWL